MCGALTAEYGVAQTAVAGEIATYINLTQRLSGFATGHPQPKDTPKDLAAEIAKYRGVVESGAYEQMVGINQGTSAKNGSPGVWDQIVANCEPRLSVTAQQTIVPDITRTFAMKPQTNIFYDDSLTFAVDANGLLTNAAPTSTSQVTAIASAIANDVGLAMAPEKAAIPAARPLAAGARCDSTAGSLDDAIDQFGKCDLANAGDQTSMGVLASLIFAQLPHAGSLENLPATTLPRTVYVSLDDFDDSGNVTSTTDPKPSIDDLQKLFGLTLKLECSPRKAEAGAADVSRPENVKPAAANIGVYDGIVVSASRSCRLRGTQVHQNTSMLVAQSYFWAQDSRDLTVLPTSRGFLVKRSVGYTFASGQPTGVTDSRPSEALALVSFPGAVIGSFVGGIATGATSRTAKTGARTTELTAQTNYLTAQANYLAAQAQVAKAKSATGASQ